MDSTSTFFFYGVDNNASCGVPRLTIVNVYYLYCACVADGDGSKYVLSVLECHQAHLSVGRIPTSSHDQPCRSRGLYRRSKSDTGRVCVTTPTLNSAAAWLHMPVEPASCVGCLNWQSLVEKKLDRPGMYCLYCTQSSLSENPAVCSSAAQLVQPSGTSCMARNQ